jgi:hypothetical protein
MDAGGRIAIRRALAAYFLALLARLGAFVVVYGRVHMGGHVKTSM